MSLLTIDRSRHPGVALLTLNRPERHNALNKALLAELDTFVAHAIDDADIRCLVLTGAGDRSFSAGADIFEQEGLSPAQAYEHMRWGQAIFARIERLPKPSIAALNGLAIGGGLELALACDVRIAADTAELALPEVTMATVPGWGGVQRVLRLSGVSNAKLMTLTGRRLTAAQAFGMGLVNLVHTREDLLKEALALAAEIADHSPEAVASLKSLIEQAQNGDREPGHEAAARAVERLWALPGRRLAQERFMLRRRP